MYFIVEMYAFHKSLDKTRQGKRGLRIWKKRYKYLIKVRIMNFRVFFSMFPGCVNPS